MSRDGFFTLEEWRTYWAVRAALLSEELERCRMLVALIRLRRLAPW